MFVENSASVNYGEICNIFKYNYKCVALTGFNI